MKHRTVALALALAISPAVYAADSDSPAVKEHIAKAIKIAGSQWAAQEDFFCEKPYPNLPADALIRPMKICC